MPTKQKTLLSKLSGKKIELGLGNSKISLFIKLIWEKRRQLAFVTIRYVIRNCLSFAANKQDTKFLTV